MKEICRTRGSILSTFRFVVDICCGMHPFLTIQYIIHYIEEMWILLCSEGVAVSKA